MPAGPIIVLVGTGGLPALGAAGPPARACSARGLASRRFRPELAERDLLRVPLRAGRGRRLPAARLGRSPCDGRPRGVVAGPLAGGLRAWTRRAVMFDVVADGMRSVYRLTGWIAGPPARPGGSALGAVPAHEHPDGRRALADLARENGRGRAAGRRGRRTGSRRAGRRPARAATHDREVATPGRKPRSGTASLAVASRPPCRRPGGGDRDRPASWPLDDRCWGSPAACPARSWAATSSCGG